MARTMDPDAWVDALEQFEHHLIASEMKARTVELRVYQLRRFARDHPSGPDTITPQQVLKYVARTDWAPATRAVVRASLTSFFGWAVTGPAPLARSNPTTSLPTVKQARKTPRLPDRKVVRAALKNTTPRVQFMIRLAADAGLSAMEIATSRRGDIHERDGEYTIRTQARGDTVRVVPLPPSLAEDLLALGGDYLFPNPKNGKPMGPAFISRLVSNALPDEFTSDSLRLAFLASGSATRQNSWREASFHAPEEWALADGTELANVKGLHKHLRQIERFAETDPATAISECKNLIESLTRTVLDDFDALPKDHPSMGELKDALIETLRLREDSIEGDERASNHLANFVEGSIGAAFTGLNQMRNNLGTGHGGGGDGKAEPHHARLAFNLTVALAEYMVARWRQLKE